MTRYVKRGGQVWIRVFPDKPITKKPLEVRMGSGKGNVEYYVAKIKPGEWFNAFLRTRDRHHDCAFFPNEEGDAPRLNHVCFAVPSVDRIVQVCDLLVERGIFLDSSLGRTSTTVLVRSPPVMRTSPIGISIDTEIGRGVS